MSAGIGVLGMASPMLQEVFGGALIGKPEPGFASLNAGQKAAIAEIAAAFAGLLSLFNISSREGPSAHSKKADAQMTHAPDSPPCVGDYTVLQTDFSCSQNGAGLDRASSGSNTEKFL